MPDPAVSESELSLEPDSPEDRTIMMEPDGESLTWIHPFDLTSDHILADARWAPFITDRLCQDLNEMLQALSVDIAYEAEAFSCCWTSNDDLQRLNHQFRDKDKPTNVLSFPDETDGQLGDLAFGYEIMAQEATSLDIPLEHHIRHLLIHGLLHLYGFDHLNDEEAREMEALEIKALAHLDIPNPYQGELV